MEARVRPVVDEAPPKRARTTSAFALPPLTDELTASILCLLPPVTQLRVIPLPYREHISDATVVRVLVKCARLRTLSLKHCAVSDEVTAHLPSHLRQLDLSWCSKLSVDAYRPLGSLPMLQSLNLGWCANIKDASLRHLPPSLTLLRLGGCVDVTDEGLQCVERLTSLTSLQLSGCEKITPKVLVSLPASLRVLEVFICPLISDDDLRKLPQRIHVLGRVWPELKVLRSTALTQPPFSRLTPLAPLAGLHVAPPAAATPAAAGPAAALLPASPLPPLQLNPTPTPPGQAARGGGRTQTAQAAQTNTSPAHSVQTHAPTQPQPHAPAAAGPAAHAAPPAAAQAQAHSHASASLPPGSTEGSSAARR